MTSNKAKMVPEEFNAIASLQANRDPLRASACPKQYNTAEGSHSETLTKDAQRTDLPQ
jgi:hypothetical protein